MEAERNKLDIKLTKAVTLVAWPKESEAAVRPISSAWPL